MAETLRNNYDKILKECQKYFTKNNNNNNNNNNNDDNNGQNTFIRHNNNNDNNNNDSTNNNNRLWKSSHSLDDDADRMTYPLMNLNNQL